MPGNDLPESKHVSLSIDRPEQLLPIARALASPVRLDMLRLLGGRSHNVGELAEALALPVSTAALNVRVLEAAGLVACEQQPGVRGTMKLCHRRLDTVAIGLSPRAAEREAVLSMALPVGCYSFAEDIAPTCGLAGTRSAIGEEDNPRTFFFPDRFSAQLLWLRHGHVTYHFSILSLQEIEVDWLEVSFEACSEAPMYRDPWPSDIDVSINGASVGVWTSPCDYGGRRGRLNPAWWSDLSTQYGELKTWRIDKKGSTLDGVPVSGTTIADLRLDAQPSIAVRVGVAQNAAHVGGMNLFGKGFGDWAQDIVMRVGYTVRQPD